MNTTYKSSVKPQFEGLQPQDATLDLSQPRQMLSELGKGLEQEAKTLQDIALDEAQISFNRGAAELVDKYGTDFKGLDDAMMKLENESYQKFAQRNPALATKLLKQQDAVRLRAVDAAHKTYISTNNRKIKESSGALLEGFKIAMPDDYANYLYQMTLPAEQRDVDIIGQWENNLGQIDQLLNRRDMEGNYIFDEKTRKQKTFIQDYMADGGKTLVDRYFANNDKEGLQKYYEQHILAPERYMKETGMNRATYDKVRSYAKSALEQMGVEAKKLTFNQSIADAMALQYEFSDEKLAELEESGVLPKKITKSLKDTNVKFSMMDASKEELPTALIDTIDIVNSFNSEYADTEDAKLKTVDEGLNAMSELADYAQKNGLSPRNIKRAQEMIVNKEQDAVFADIYKSFGGIIDNFNKKLGKVRTPQTTLGKIRQGFEEITKWDGMSNAERNTITQLESILTSSIDQIHYAKANNEPIVPIMEKTYFNVAKLYYQNDIKAEDWAKVEADRDAVIMFRGEPVKIKGFTNADNGYIIFERQ